MPPSRTRDPAPGSVSTHVARRDGLGVRRVADSTSSPAASSFWTAAALVRPSTPGVGGVAGPAEPPGAEAGGGGDQQRDAPAAAGRGGTGAGGAAAAERTGRTGGAGGRGCGSQGVGVLARPGAAAAAARSAASSAPSRGRPRCRRLRTVDQLAGVRVQRRTRGEVGGELGVVLDAVGQRLGDPVELVQQHAGVGRALGPVAGGGAGDQRVDVRRDAGHEPRTAAGRPRGRACRRPGSATRPRAACGR